MRITNRNSKFRSSSISKTPNKSKTYQSDSRRSYSTEKKHMALIKEAIKQQKKKTIKLSNYRPVRLDFKSESSKNNLIKIRCCKANLSQIKLKLKKKLE